MFFRKIKILLGGLHFFGPENLIQGNGSSRTDQFFWMVFFESRRVGRVEVMEIFWKPEKQKELNLSFHNHPKVLKSVQ